MTDRIKQHAEFERDGFVLMPQLLDEGAVSALIDAFEQQNHPPLTTSDRRGSVYGMRNLLRDVPLVREICHLPGIRNAVHSILGVPTFAVRALFFDKTPGANWHVVWHQDLTIAVQERVDLAGFGVWSVKGGIDHVQPPLTVLRKMVALRLHLDDCGEDNGPLRVLPGTHQGERWNVEQIAKRRAEIPETICVARRGDGLLMSPLLLHASGTVTGTATHRRILHIEWACEELPEPLCWFDRI